MAGGFARVRWSGIQRPVRLTSGREHANRQATAAREPVAESVAAIWPRSDQARGHPPPEAVANLQRDEQAAGGHRPTTNASVEANCAALAVRLGQPYTAARADEQAPREDRQRRRHRRVVDDRDPQMARRLGKNGAEAPAAAGSQVAHGHPLADVDVLCHKDQRRAADRATRIAVTQLAANYRAIARAAGDLRGLLVGWW
jgi:hypothetical protein